MYELLKNTILGRLQLCDLLPNPTHNIHETTVCIHVYRINNRSIIHLVDTF